MSLQRSEIIHNFPQHEGIRFDRLTFDPRGNLGELATSLTIWGAEDELRFAESVEKVPTVDLRQQVDHKGVRADLFIAAPEDIQLSKDQSDVLILPGYLATIPAYEDYARELAAVTGARVGVVELPLTHGLLKKHKDLHPRHVLNPFRLEGQIAVAAAQHLQQSRIKDAQPISIVGHSKGGGVGAEMVAHKPDLFNKLVLNKTAGMQDHSFIEMLSRAKNCATQEIAPLISSHSREQAIRLGVSTVRHVLSSPTRLILQGYRAGTLKGLHEQIAQIRSNDISVYAQWGRTDEFFDFRQEITSEIMSGLDGGLLMDGNHVLEQGKPTIAALGTAYLLGSSAVSTLRPRIA